MPTTTPPRRRARPFASLVHKPNGVIHPRVQKVGPEHFAVVSIDPAKCRSKWMMADFYGTVLIEPTPLEHDAKGFQGAVEAVRRQIETSRIEDVIVVIERTGKFHHPAKRAFSDAGFEVRVIHPFTTKQFRQPAHPDRKTDDTDLAAIHRGTVNGFGLTEPVLPEGYAELRAWARHRRDLVKKSAALRCQITDLLHEGFPGYEKCFGNMFLHDIALLIPRHLGTPEEIRQAGRAGIERLARRAGVRFQGRTLERVLAWADQAGGGGPLPELRREILRDLEHDRAAKARQIARSEGEMARYLVRTPYVLLLGIPGINVVSAADVAGELGPITSYAGARQMTGRAGLYPRRYQSDRVDHADGPLAVSGNRALRRALTQVADNLIRCNHHFRALAAHWLGLKKDKRDIRVKVADRFCRIAYQVVAGGRAYRHPCSHDRHHVISKLLAFYNEHRTGVEEAGGGLDAAVAQLPRSEYASEAAPLEAERSAASSRRGKGPRRLGEILPAVLAKLGGAPVESKTSGEVALSVPGRAAGVQTTPFQTEAQSRNKAWRSVGSPTPDRAVWGHSPDTRVWRGVIISSTENSLRGRAARSTFRSPNVHHRRGGPWTPRAPRDRLDVGKIHMAVFVFFVFPLPSIPP